MEFSLTVFALIIAGSFYKVGKMFETVKSELDLLNTKQTNLKETVDAIKIRLNDLKDYDLKRIEKEVEVLKANKNPEK